MISLIIAHNIFLTREQRYALAEEDNITIDVLGYNNVTINTKTKIKGCLSNEIFCNYTISNRLKLHMVNYNETGYEIYLHEDKYKKSLKDPLDGGSSSIKTVYKRRCRSKNKKIIENTNYISIHDWKVLTLTLG